MFDGVAEGQLKINASFPDNLKPGQWSDEDWTDSGNLTDFGGTFERALAEIKDDLAAIEKDLESVFSDKWTFVFGGGSTFFIDRCMFNRCVLAIVHLRYWNMVLMVTMTMIGRAILSPI